MNLTTIKTMILFLLLPSVDTDVDKAPLDLKKYMGTWYEIARYDHWFERSMQGVTAQYSLNDDGTVKVINSGYKDSIYGKKKTAYGRAKMADEKCPRCLKVSFFLWFYSPYNILEIDKKEYSWVLVGSSSDKYLWILSRTHELPKSTLDHIFILAQKRGYDTSKLIMVKQKTQ